MKTIEQLSEKYSTWIIKYCPIHFDYPLFLIWYTDIDKNRTDKLLTYKNGNIFAVKSLSDIKLCIESYSESLVLFDNLNSWLKSTEDLNLTEFHTYDIISVVKEISKNNMDILTLEGFTSFVNLFGDFTNQDERNSELVIYSKNDLIQKAFDYTYDYIFWPRFNNEKNFKAWNVPKLNIDAKELLERLKDMINAFETNIKEVGTAIC